MKMIFEDYDKKCDELRAANALLLALFKSDLTAASIKKFYKCMLAHGKITETDYANLCCTIKDYMEDWQSVCAAYNDPKIEDPFLFF